MYIFFLLFLAETNSFYDTATTEIYTLSILHALPTYQNNDFWNLPEKYVNVIYPECSYMLKVEGDYWEYIHDKEIEQWVLI